MNKKGHVILAAILSFAFILFTGYLNLAWFTFSFASVLIISGIIVFYSLLPDIDHKNSTMTWWFFGVGVLGLLVGIMELVFDIEKINPITIFGLSTILLVFTFLAANLFDHRGFIHSIPVGILSVLPLWFLFSNIAYCVLAYLAWHSHLLGDGLWFKIR